MAQLNLPTKQKQTHRHTGTDCGWQGAEGRGEGQDWGFGISRSKLVCIGWINKKALLYSTVTFHFHALEKEMATRSSVLA